jgi:Ca-activated chloride channel family protein
MIEDGDLVPEFAALMTAAMGKAVPDVRLHVRTTPFARLRFVRQTFPTEIDLTPFGVAVDRRTTAFSTGSWGAEEREFLVGLDVNRLVQHPMDQDIQAAKVELAVVPAGGTTAVPAARAQPVLVHWTNDVRLSSMTNPKVDHYSGHAELGAAMLDGWRAYKNDDLVLAAAEWGRALALATSFGHHSMLTRLHRIVDITGDPAAGQVTVKENLRDREFLSAILHSNVSTHSPDSPPDHGLARPGADQKCANCAYVSPASAKVCQKCRSPLVKTA